MTAFAQGNDYVGLAVASTVSRPAVAWWAPVETVSGKGSSTVPWPAFTLRFVDALNEAFSQFEQGLDSAARLREFVAARGSGRSASYDIDWD